MSIVCSRTACCGQFIALHRGQYPDHGPTLADPVVLVHTMHTCVCLPVCPLYMQATFLTVLRSCFYLRALKRRSAGGSVPESLRRESVSIERYIQLAYVRITAAWFRRLKYEIYGTEPPEGAMENRSVHGHVFCRALHSACLHPDITPPRHRCRRLQSSRELLGRPCRKQPNSRRHTEGGQGQQLHGFLCSFRPPKETGDIRQKPCCCGVRYGVAPRLVCLDSVCDKNVQNHPTPLNTQTHHPYLALLYGALRWSDDGRDTIRRRKRSPWRVRY